MELQTSNPKSGQMAETLKAKEDTDASVFSVANHEMPEVPASVYCGSLFTVTLLGVLVVAVIKKSCQWSILGIGWSLSLFLFAMWSIARGIALVCGAAGPMTNSQELISGIYYFTVCHAWMIFFAAFGCATGSWLFSRYWKNAVAGANDRGQNIQTDTDLQKEE